jgi:hypothetical protein
MGFVDEESSAFEAALLGAHSVQALAPETENAL